ncbi:4-coumarate--CoA ligase 1-like [Lingula anatina]|uniref:Luciferin 4-monooxygenase n=1 Tax=Lingula anatina TaxID=7574 RepID=A0A1S3K959_LINAN|nr:4-coumarate--CoA ligase 1-like [Lingula anatina]|eukprot:XP_013419160.1 4-coumarate--CoA ligase 1-like [Lingula anatina]
MGRHAVLRWVLHQSSWSHPPRWSCHSATRLTGGFSQQKHTVYSTQWLRSFGSTPPVRSSSIVKSPYPDIDLTTKPLAEDVMKDWAKFGNHMALVDGTTGQSYTYSQLKDAVIRCASALVRLGFKKGDTLALYSPNVPDYATVFIATAALGGTVTCANPMYTPEELGNQLKRSNTKILVTHEMVAGHARDALAMAPNVKETIVFGNVSGFRPFTSILEDDGHAFPENVDINTKEDVLAQPYSSGTTGLPKGVMLSHYNITSNIAQLNNENVMNYEGPEEVLTGLLPFFHIYGQVVVMLTGLKTGSKIITLPKFQLEYYLETIQNHRATILHAVPPIIIALAKSPLVDSYDLSSVRNLVTGAAPCTEAIASQCVERLKLNRFQQAYGLTETSPVTHCNPPVGYKLGSIGFALPNTEFKVIDLENGADLGPMEEGELLVRGPQVMLGYHDNPDATANTIKDGWLHTGDIGYRDQDDHMWISDRVKELIKYKGFQVPPAELEGLILAHPAVQDVAVIGIPDDIAGELPRAYVVRKPNMDVKGEEIDAFLDEHIAPYKKLRGGIEFIDEIPKTASGKILRRLLKEQALKGR